MWYQIFSKIYEKAARKMAEQCQEYIEKGEKILDLGCGSGIVASVFQDFFQAEVVGVDIADSTVRDISFQIMSGKEIPFPDNSFDSVLIAFVLHHAKDPVSLLKEAKRISRKRIIVYEDLPEGPASSFFCRLHGFSFDRWFQNKKTTSFKKERDWKKIFNQLELDLIAEKEASSDLNPVQKKLFVLQKK